MSLKELDDYILGNSEKIDISNYNIANVHLIELNDIKGIIKKRNRKDVYKRQVFIYDTKASKQRGC